MEKVTDADFVMVALDGEGRPKPVPAGCGKRERFEAAIGASEGIPNLSLRSGSGLTAVADGSDATYVGRSASPNPTSQFRVGSIGLTAVCLPRDKASMGTAVSP